MHEPLEEFLRRHGQPDTTTLIDADDTPDQWPTLVVRHGSHTAAIQCRGLTDPHADTNLLSLIVHGFTDGQPARAGVHGAENGTPYTGFADHATAGTSHGWPAVASVTVLIGRQDDAPQPLFTVVGVWDGDEPVPVGVVAGAHQVSGGDTDHFEGGLWATTVAAADADSAQQRATDQIREAR